LICTPALADPLLLGGGETGLLGARASYLVEGSAPLSLGDATRALRRGDFRPGTSAVVSFGIGSRPVWMHLQFENPGDQPLALRLAVGKTWIDQLDVTIVHGGRIHQAWRAGDAYPGAAALAPAIGFLFPARFPPGLSELFIRAHSADPLVLPVSLLPRERVAAGERWTHYRHGLMYGFLLAFIIYNGILFLGLRTPSYLYYSLYLLCFILLSLAYTGHAYAWIWPQYPLVQRYAMLVLAVVFGCAGFLFASRFLLLAAHAPAVKRWVGRVSLSAIALMVLCVALDSHLGAVWLAFGFSLLFALGMVLLGVLTIRHGQQAGRYFLWAALCSMLGLASIALAVAGYLPVNALTFHGIEIGVMLEATLLSLALSSRLRQQEQARKDAEQLARIDSLTGLLNRRAFCEDAARIWSTALRHNRILSVIMLDLDHFKSINDSYGHDMGDRVLVAVAQILSASCRTGDILARWGGEEFVLLLPETDLQQACLFSERIRSAIEERQLVISSQQIALSVSLGAAQRAREATLEKLVCQADNRLYDAKRHGRNQVSPAMAMTMESPA
jgi:diguanylate cyclase (GGDEF)-like protein